MHKRLSIWVWTIWLLAAGAHAQLAAGDKAAAEALFDRGLSLLREGKLEEACARLEQSQAIERGIGTMLYLAECHEKSGRTASAWALFREAASEAQAAGQVERAVAGRQRAERLEPQLSRLTVEVPEAHRVQGLEVSRNGVLVAKGVWGLPLPVDPGEQRIEARAPGYLSQTLVAQVDKGPTSTKATIPALVAAPVTVADNTPMQTAPVQTMPPATSDVDVGVAPKEPRGLPTQKLVGILVGSAGVVLLAVGTGFGIRAINKNDDAKGAGCEGKLCNGPQASRGVDLTDQALGAAKVANFGFIAGGALVAGGLLTYFLTPKSDKQTKVALSADPRGAALHVGGVF